MGEGAGIIVGMRKDEVDKLGFGKGSPGPKRRAEEREADLVLEAERYLAGDTHAKIAAYIGERRSYKLTPQTVRLDIQELHQRWVLAQLIDFNAAMAKELVRIDRLEGAYWEGWERSIREFVETKTTNVEDQFAEGRGGKEGEAYVRKKVEQTVRELVGESKFLDGVGKCIEQRCKILGLYAPEKVEINWKEEARSLGINPDEVIDGLVRDFLESAEQRGASGLDAGGGAGGVGKGETEGRGTPEG